MKSFGSIYGSPAKDNITLLVKRRPRPNAKGNNATTPYEYIFEPVIQKLQTELDVFGITIIYCISMQWLGHGYEMTRRILGNDFYAGEKTTKNTRVVMYHSSMSSINITTSIYRHILISPHAGKSTSILVV